MVAWALMALCIGAEPARGSAKGPWVFADLNLAAGGTLGESRVVAPSTSATVGFGIDIAHFRLNPSVTGHFGFQFPLQEVFAVFMNPVFVDFTLYATDLLAERVTGLRLSPLFSVAHTPHIEGRVLPETVLKLGLVVERRFGPVEVSYRPEGRRFFADGNCAYASSFCLEPEWEISQRLFVEGWLVPSFSLGAGVSWWATWGDPHGALLTPPPYSAKHHIGAYALATWAFSRFFGASIGAQYTHGPQWMQLTWSTNNITAFVSLWVRSDAGIQRNWLER